MNDKATLTKVISENGDWYQQTLSEAKQSDVSTGKFTCILYPAVFGYFKICTSGFIGYDGGVYFQNYNKIFWPVLSSRAGLKTSTSDVEVICLT